MGWNWYGVKTVFRTESRGKPTAPDSFYDPTATLVEERIVLIRARSFDEAIRKAEKEATQYCKESFINAYGQKVETRYLDACDVFELLDNPDAGVEVFSAIRVIDKATNDKSIINKIFGMRVDQEGLLKRKRFLNREFNKAISKDT